jgi:hypothetical protein
MEGGAGPLMVVGCSVPILEIGILVGVSDIVVIRGLLKDFLISGYPRRASASVNGSERALLKYSLSESLRAPSWPLVTCTSQEIANTVDSTLRSAISIKSITVTFSTVLLGDACARILYKTSMNDCFLTIFGVSPS